MGKKNKKSKPKRQANLKTVEVQESIKKMIRQKSPQAIESRMAFQKNLSALQKRYPGLAQKIKDTELKNYAVTCAAPGKPPNLLNKSLNRTYYRPEDPMGEVKEQLEALKLKNTRLAVFLGFGLGYELFYFIQNMAREQLTSHILIIEKEFEVFKAALQAVDLTDILANENITFLVGLPHETLYVELRSYLNDQSRFLFLRAMKPVYHLSSIQADKNYYLSALKHLRDSGSHQVLNYGNDPQDSIVGVENMLENIQEIVFNPGVNLLFNRFHNKPGIVVATGPSLNKNKHLLKGLEDKALIISADASLKILLEMGVKPHLVTSLERVPAVLNLLGGIKAEEAQDVYLAACPVVLNAVYRAYPGPRIIVYRDFDHFRWLDIDRGILKIQLSAGNMAFKVAEALGCNPIIIIGQDLAYGREGHTHARGATLGEIQGEKDKVRTVEVMGNNGKRILTNETWYSFLKAYEMDVAAYRGNCINSTEGGAYIQGTIVMPFREAIEKYVGENIKPLVHIRDCIDSFSTAEAERDYHKVKELIDRTANDLQSIYDNCREGLDYCNKYQKDLSEILAGSAAEKEPGKNLQQMHKEITRPREECSTRYNHTYQLFFMHILQSFNIKFEMDLIAVPEKYDTREQTLAEILVRHREWYAVTGDLAKILIDLLEETKEKMENSEIKVAEYTIYNEEWHREAWRLKEVLTGALNSIKEEAAVSKPAASAAAGTRN